MFDSLETGMYATRGAVCTAVNPAAERLLGYPAGELMGTAIHDLIHYQRPDGSPLADAQCPLFAVLRTGRPARCDDDTFWRKDGTSLTVAWSSAPVRAGADDEVIGTVVLFSDATDQRRDQEQREAALVSERVAGDRLALLAAAGEVLATLDADDGLRRLARLLVAHPADWVVVDLLVEGQVVRAVAQSAAGRVESAGLPGQLGPLAAGSTGWLADVLHGAGAIAVPGFPDPDSTPDPLHAAQLRLFRDIGATSALVVPLRARGHTLGAMTWVRDTATPDAFTADDLTLAAELGRRAALAVDNARLFALQRQAAEVLQRSMLPRLPALGGLQLAARYLPAGEGAEVGGDWYDAFVLPDGATALVVGDVVGHDLAAAATMGQLRNLLRGAAVDRSEPPSDILRRVDLMIDVLAVPGLATCLLARVEQVEGDRLADRRRLRWSNAGHLPPLLLDDAGSVTALDDGGDLLLGVDSASPRVDHEHVVEVGSTLLLYSDGLVERRGSSLDAGLARLRQALATLADRPLELLCDELLERLVPLPSDDVALLAVRFHRQP